ncbi:hypothetical protein NM688_g6394 [Phlebia brevispora]|uniref:Uncharacterized protein n=1 Tax=Phlebia brevispora TaxID=194682 RepID=A0ACC1SGI5_9APHY|nr:hypothetical protein NM688_g6394 [Phlebia brevispora]
MHGVAQGKSLFAVSPLSPRFSLTARLYMVSLHLLTVFSWLFMVHGTFASWVNVTVDDELGDPQSGIKPTYTPPGSWLLKTYPAFNSIHYGTLHFMERKHKNNQRDELPTITLNFTGTAVYLYFLVPSRDVTDLQISVDGLIWETCASKLVNSDTLPHFHGREIALSPLPFGEHAVSISPIAGSDSVMYFDYAVYTTLQPEVETPSASSQFRAEVDIEPRSHPKVFTSKRRVHASRSGALLHKGVSAGHDIISSASREDTTTATESGVDSSAEDNPAESLGFDSLIQRSFFPSSTSALAHRSLHRRTIYISRSAIIAISVAGGFLVTMILFIACMCLRAARRSPISRHRKYRPSLALKILGVLLFDAQSTTGGCPSAPSSLVSKRWRDAYNRLYSSRAGG